MSDNIPFEIQSQIIKHLPLKSLLQFRTVSKPWKSFIDSPNFISDYTFRNPNQPHHLLIAYKHPSSQSNYISIADDLTFPQTKLHSTLPASINLIHNSTLVGSSHGLVCLCICHQNRFDFVIWNPSIRKSFPIPLATTDCDREVAFAFGFGVCPVTNVPKLVQISNILNTWKVEVFSFSSGVWTISAVNPPSKSVQFDWCHSQVTVGRFVYWFATENDTEIDADDGDVVRNVVISFDLLSEVFEEIRLPENLAVYDSTNYLCKRNDLLAVVKENKRGVFEVWVMENGVSKAFTKLFTVNIPYNLPYESAYISSFPIGFNRKGEILMVINEGSPLQRKEISKVVVCKPWVEGIEDVVIEGELESLMVSSYTESLLLFHH